MNSATAIALLHVIGISLLMTLIASPFLFAMAWLVSVPYRVRRRAVLRWLRSWR